MKRIKLALTDPLHLAFLLPVVLLNLMFQILDLLGYAEPRYDFLCFAFTFAYLLSFALSLINGRVGAWAEPSDD